MQVKLTKNAPQVHPNPDIKSILRKDTVYTVREKHSNGLLELVGVDGSWDISRFDVLPDVNPLTQLDVPFGKLDEETKVALFRAYLQGATIQAYLSGLEEWRNILNNPSWCPSNKYRIKPLTSFKVDLQLKMEKLVNEGQDLDTKVANASKVLAEIVEAKKANQAEIAALKVEIEEG